MTVHKSGHPLRRELAAANPFGSALNGSMAEAMERGASVFGTGMRTLQQESVKFMTRRFEDNVQAAKRFSACRSLPDVFAAQQKWFADMTHAYSEEWVRCSELMTDALQKDMRSAGNGAERPHHRR